MIAPKGPVAIGQHSMMLDRIRELTSHLEFGGGFAPLTHSIQSKPGNLVGEGEIRKVPQHGLHHATSVGKATTVERVGRARQALLITSLSCRWSSVSEIFGHLRRKIHRLAPTSLGRCLASCSLGSGLGLVANRTFVDPLLALPRRRCCTFDLFVARATSGLDHLRATLSLGERFLDPSRRASIHSASTTAIGAASPCGTTRATLRAASSLGTAASFWTAATVGTAAPCWATSAALGTPATCRTRRAPFGTRATRRPTGAVWATGATLRPWATHGALHTGVLTRIATRTPGAGGAAPYRRASIRRAARAAGPTIGGFIITPNRTRCRGTRTTRCTIRSRAAGLRVAVATVRTGSACAPSGTRRATRTTPRRRPARRWATRRRRRRTAIGRRHRASSLRANWAENDETPHEGAIVVPSMGKKASRPPKGPRV